MTFVDGPPRTGEDDDLEVEADAFAARTLIPSERDRVLPTLRTKQAIKEFAAAIGIHPGVVVGRLQHEHLLPHNRFNDMRERYAFVDE